MTLRNPATILYDANGVAHAVKDGVSIPANTPGLFLLGKEGSTARFIDVIDDSGTKRLAVDVAGIADITGAVTASISNQSLPTTPVIIPSDPGLIVKDELKNGSSPDLLVDGSSTAVNFRFNADATDDIALSELRLVLGANSIHFDATKFGAVSSLTNGVQINVRAQSTTITIDTLKDNTDLLALVSPTSAFFNDTGPTSVVAVGLSFGGQVVLDGGSSDYLEVKIQDDLTSSTFTHFQATIWAVKS